MKALKFNCSKYSLTCGEIILRCLSFWVRNTEIRLKIIDLIILVDKCIRAQIVDPGSVARWIFSHEMAKYFNRHYIWEILNSTIVKMNHHVNRVQDEYDNILQRQQNSSIKMEEGRTYAVQILAVIF